MSQKLHVDVRTRPEYERGHIPGALHLPLHKVKRFREELADKDVVFDCRTGVRAARACQNAGGEATGVEQFVREGHTLAYEQETVWPMDRQVRLGAGSLVLLGTALGVFVNAWFFALAAFVGAGLTYSGVTDTCGMAKALARMPWNSRSDQEIREQLSARTA